MPVSADIIDIIYRTTGPTTPVLLVPSFVTNPEILEIDTPKQKPELVLVLVISVASTIADIVKCYMVYRERELKRTPEPSETFKRDNQRSNKPGCQGVKPRKRHLRNPRVRSNQQTYDHQENSSEGDANNKGSY